MGLGFILGSVLGPPFLETTIRCATLMKPTCRENQNLATFVGVPFLVKMPMSRTPRAG